MAVRSNRKHAGTGSASYLRMHEAPTLFFFFSQILQYKDQGLFCAHGCIYLQPCLLMFHLKKVTQVSLCCD